MGQGKRATREGPAFRPASPSSLLFSTVALLAYFLTDLATPTQTTVKTAGWAWDISPDGV